MFVSAPQAVPARFCLFVCFFFKGDLPFSKILLQLPESRLTPRKVGLFTCVTGMFFSFSVSFSLIVESKKSIACVLLQLISMQLSFAQELTLCWWSLSWHVWLWRCVRQRSKQSGHQHEGTLLHASRSVVDKTADPSVHLTWHPCSQQFLLQSFVFFCVPQLYLWGSPFLGEIFEYVTVFLIQPLR